MKIKHVTLKKANLERDESSPEHYFYHAKTLRAINLTTSECLGTALCPKITLLWGLAPRESTKHFTPSPYFSAWWDPTVG